MSFFSELKRRNVFRVGIAYLISSWLLAQIAELLLDTFGAPDWTMKFIVVALLIGFPIAIFFAWAFELTPDGVKRETAVGRDESIAPQTGKKLNNTILVLMALAIAYLLFDKFSAPVQPGTDHFSQQASSQTIGSNEKSALSPIEAPVEAAIPADTKKSIVVLPFLNMSNDPDQEFFSDGLSEELLNVLAQIEDLRVISRTSAFAFKGKDVDIPTIASQLDVTHVLEGSVRKAGDNIRITAQLIEVATDSHLWSHAYNRKMENVFEIQEEISKAIANELTVKLGTGGRAGKPTENLEAYQLFLRGRYLYQSRGIAQVQMSLELLKQAVELDPGFVEAWATLAAANIVTGYNDEVGFKTYSKNGQQAALHAIGLDPDNGFAHAVLGLVHMGNLAWEDAMQEYDLAIRLNPNESNTLLWKGIALLGLGYIEEGLAIFHEAEKLDPVFTNLQFWLWNAYTVKGDVESMLSTYQKIQLLDPGFAGVNLSDYELFSGNLDAAEQIARANATQALGSDVIPAAVFSALRDPKRKEEAVKTLLANREMLDWGEDLTIPFWRIGATEEALSAFQATREEGMGLHVSNGLNTIWTAYDREQLIHPALPSFFERFGLADYWRKHGNPDYCRVEGENIECGAQ